MTSGRSARLFDRASGVVRLAGNDDVVGGREQLAETFDDDRMVIDKEDRNHDDLPPRASCSAFGLTFRRRPGWFGYCALTGV